MAIKQVQSTEETQTDPPGIDDTESLGLKSNHIHCKSTDDESGTENTLSRKTLEIEIEYETPNDSNYYQNNENFKTLEIQTMDKPQ